MKYKILIIFILLISILGISIYVVLNYRNAAIQSQKINNEYKELYNINVSGTELVSIMNRTADINEKRNIPKDQEGLYTDDGQNSIIIYVNLIYKDGYKTLRMEKILNDGVENFIKSYSVANFKCTEIINHDKTKNVKELTFTENTN